jgi:hypothetical protein
MYIDKRKGKYTININTSDTEYTKNNVSNKLVNKITTIDSEGNVIEKNVESNKTNVTSTINQIINLSNNDINAINNITSTLDINNIMVTLTKNDLDASMFTMNKEYIINDPNHKEYNGRYLISSTKQIFIKQTDYFIMTTVLTFKKLKS